MALRGNLKELSLPDIFQLVTFSGKTGVLRIRRADDAQGSVWFRDGEVFFAQSNWRTEPLGERLVRAQRITPMALERALELRAEEGDDGKRLGEILIEQGYITDKVLEAFVQEQMQDTIFDLMRWDEGDFEFEAMPDTLEEDIGLAVSIENVIMEGSRRLDEWNRIKKKIPSVEIVFKMATAPGEGTFEISLKPIEWNLLLLVDGTRSVAELALETNRTDFEVARVLYGLFSAGLLEFAADEEVATSRAERIAREARLAEVEAERSKEQTERDALAEAKAKAEAEAKAAAAAAQAPAATEAEQPVAGGKARKAAAKRVPVEAAEVAHEEPVEEPEFLGAPTSSATAEDLDMLEAAMGALLDTAAPAPAAPPAVERAAYAPGEEPAFIGASQETQLDEGTAVPSVEELLGDIEGLTVEQAIAEPVEVAEPNQVAEPAGAVVELAAETEPASEPALEAAAETAGDTGVATMAPVEQAQSNLDLDLQSLVDALGEPEPIPAASPAVAEGGVPEWEMFAGAAEAASSEVPQEVSFEELTTIAEPSPASVGEFVLPDVTEGAIAVPELVPATEPASP